MSFAIGFIAFRQRQVKGDTIPKPVGLGFRRPLSGLSVRQRSSVCPGFVRPSSSIGFRLYGLNFALEDCWWKVKSRIF
jgi:hypothetical protein